MSYSHPQVLHDSSQELRRLALEYRNEGKISKFKDEWAAAKRLIRRAIEVRKSEQKWKMGAPA